jgi:hypothetical protein
MAALSCAASPRPGGAHGGPRRSGPAEHAMTIIWALISKSLMPKPPSPSRAAAFQLVRRATVRMKLWVALGAIPLDAVIVSG